MTKKTPSSSSPSIRRSRVPPQHTWLTIFLPALLYYIFLSSSSPSLSSNNSVSNSSNNGILAHLGLLPNHFTFVPTALTKNAVPTNNSKSNNIKLESIFPSSKSTPNQFNFEYIIQNHNPTSTKSNDSDNSSKSQMPIFTSKLVDTLWIEDAELGRGYLLASDINHHGIIWRYEVGGGPIPIGKSLFMNYSGCRSKKTCTISSSDSSNHKSDIYNTFSQNGSSGMTIQVQKDEESFHAGQLIIVEKGEERIVRLEKDGSRTPLVLNTTVSLCRSSGNGNGNERIHDPNLVYYTPFGDLLFTDRLVQGCEEEENSGESKQKQRRSGFVSGLYRLKEIVNIPSLSFEQSKEAHGWTEFDLKQYWNEHDSSSLSSMELLYSGDFEYISDVVVGKDLTTLYIAGRMTGGTEEGENEHERSVKYGIVKVPLDDEEEDEDDDDDDDDDDTYSEEKTGSANKDINTELQTHENERNDEDENNNKTSSRTPGILDSKTTIFYDMTALFHKNNLHQSTLDNLDAGISLTIDHNGLLFATYPNGIAILKEKDGDLVGNLEFTSNTATVDDSQSVVIPNSINIGKDQYMYVTTQEGLMRLKTKTRPLEHPTNLIVPTRKSK